MRTLAIIAALLLGGCAWHEPTRVEEDFGKSVRQMIDAQTVSPVSATRPALRGPERLDGASAVHTVDRYEGSSKKAQRPRSQSVGDPR